jgi:hypothetical protein
MTIQVTQEWLYVTIILVLIGIQIYQQAKIRRLFEEATDLWEQLSVLTMTISNKFTEFDTKLKELEKRTDKNESKDKEVKS